MPRFRVPVRMPGAPGEAARLRIHAAQLEAIAVERENQIARQDQQIAELQGLVADLARPALSRHGGGPAGSVRIDGRSPRTRWSIAATAILIIVAIAAALILGPLLGKSSKKPAAASGNVCPTLLLMAHRLDSQFGLVITSTTGGQHAPGSYHYRGLAVDVAGSSSAMYRAAAYLQSSGIARHLYEGIHNPNLSWSHGRQVPPGFWGSATWANHTNHLHLAGCGTNLLRPAVHQRNYRDRLPLSTGRRSHGRKVVVVQRKLNRVRGHGTRRVHVDGRYGSATRRRVRQFQRNRRLRVDGVVGRRTYRAIRKAHR